MGMRRSTRAALTAVLVLVGIGFAGASDPGVENRIRRQDELAGRKEKVRLLNEAKEALSGADTAANRYLLGRAYGLIEELEKAREQFDWALERDATFPYPYHGLGVYLMLKGDLEGAEARFRTALKIDARLTRARIDLGKLYLIMEDPPAAEREFLAVLQYEPGNTGVRGLLGQFYLRRKKYVEAIREFRTLLSRNSTDKASQKGLAVALAMNKQVDAAITEFRKTIRLSPRDYESYFFLERLLVMKNDRDGAVAVLKQLIANAPAGHQIVKDAEREIGLIKSGAGGGKKPATLEELAAQLDSTDVQVRREAMRILLELQVTPPLRRALRAVRDPDLLVRVMAVKNAALTGGKRILGLLEVLTLSTRDRDSDERVRGAAVAGMAELECAGAVPVLLEALSDESIYVFRLAVKGLREISGRSFVEDETVPVAGNLRGSLASAWRSWWRGSRSFGAKLDCIEELTEIDNKRLGKYLAHLMTDADVMIVRKARLGFKSLTGYLVGVDQDTDTVEGRDKLKKQALAVLERGK